MKDAWCRTVRSSLILDPSSFFSLAPGPRSLAPASTRTESCPWPCRRAAGGASSGPASQRPGPPASASAPPQPPSAAWPRRRKDRSSAGTFRLCLVPPYVKNGSGVFSSRRSLPRPRFLRPAAGWQRGRQALPLRSRAAWRKRRRAPRPDSGHGDAYPPLAIRIGRGMGEFTSCPPFVKDGGLPTP